MSFKPNILTIAATQPTNPPEKPIEIPDGSSSVTIILAMFIFVSAITKLIRIVITAIIKAIVRTVFEKSYQSLIYR